MIMERTNRETQNNDTAQHQKLPTIQTTMPAL